MQNAKDPTGTTLSLQSGGRVCPATVTGNATVGRSWTQGSVSGPKPIFVSCLRLGW